MLAVLRTERLGLIGLKTAGVMVLLFAAVAGVTILLSPIVLSLYQVDSATVAQLGSSIAVPQATLDALNSPGGSVHWFGGFLPQNFWRLFQGANLMPVLAGTLVLSLVVRAVAGPALASLTRRIELLAKFALRGVGWILVFTPIGVFALAFGLGFGAGPTAVGLLTFFIASISLLMAGVTLALYPVARLFGGVPFRRFARGVAPAQVVAASTRSSLVSLPAMIEGAQDRLRLPAAATGFVLPFTVSTFKLSMAVGHVYMLLFASHFFGPQLGLGAVLGFAGMIFLFSTTVPGIPGGTPGVSTLPIFLAAGVPIQSILILDALDAIPDIFKTVLNVTADMTVATVVVAGEGLPPGSASG